MITQLAVQDEMVGLHISHEKSKIIKSDQQKRDQPEHGEDQVGMYG